MQVPLTRLLVTAVESGHLEIAKLLLAAGADPSTKDSDGVDLLDLVTTCDSMQLAYET